MKKNKQVGAFKILLDLHFKESQFKDTALQNYQLLKERISLEKQLRKQGRKQ